MGQSFSSEPVVEKETERDHNDLFTVAVSSCQGWRMSQEDNHSLILDLPGDYKAAFFAVFDGHGSARVSKHASEGLWRHLVENDMYLKGQFKDALESAFLTFDREVNESYNAQLAGTTAVSILVVDNIIYCANIGDSRAVASINCECTPLSHDHKPENPLELKRILVAGGYVLGNRVNGNLALSRAFGDFHYKSNDQLPPEQQIVSPCPDISTIDLNDDLDFVVLACDGIWDVLSSEEVVQFVIEHLERNLEVGTICELLTTRCLATDYEHVIGCDNMTVLLVCHTRGRSWNDYCTDIFNKNTKRLGVPRTRNLSPPEDVQQQITSSINELSSTTTASDTTSSSPSLFAKTDDGEALAAAAAAKVAPKSDENSSMTRQAKELLDLFYSLRRDASNQKEDEERQVSNEEQVDTVTVLDSSDERSSKSIQERNGDDESLTNKEEENSGETSAGVESQEDLSSKVNEIQLSSPDDEEDNQEEAEKKGEELSKAEESPSNEQSDEQASAESSSSANVVEIQLSSPDEGEHEEGGEATGESDTNCLDESEIEPIEIVPNEEETTCTVEDEKATENEEQEATTTNDVSEDGQSGDGD